MRGGRKGVEINLIEIVGSRSQAAFHDALESRQFEVCKRQCLVEATKRDELFRTIEAQRLIEFAFHEFGREPMGQSA